jgi:hypothetical protein
MAHQNFPLKSVGCLSIALSLLFLFGGMFSPVYAQGHYIITTVAGNGTQGVSGDGGAATAAQLYTPTDVTIDSNGNLYIRHFRK